MKLKQNQIAIAQYDNGVVAGDVYFLNSEEAKRLRRNSRTFRYWDGNNMAELRGIYRVLIAEAEVEHFPQRHIAENFRARIRFRDGITVGVTSSNTSGHIAPFWCPVPDWVSASWEDAQ